MLTASKFHHKSSLAAVNNPQNRIVWNADVVPETRFGDEERRLMHLVPAPAKNLINNAIRKPTMTDDFQADHTGLNL